MPARIVAGSTTQASPSGLGHSRVIHTNSARSLHRSQRRCGHRVDAMLSWWRRKRFSASSGAATWVDWPTYVASKRTIASIVSD